MVRKNAVGDVLTSERASRLRYEMVVMRGMSEIDFGGYLLDNYPEVKSQVKSHEHDSSVDIDVQDLRIKHGWKYRDGVCHFCDQVMPFKKGYYHQECFKEWFND